MEKRDPYNIRRLLLFYNFAMVLLSGYCFLEVGVDSRLSIVWIGCMYESICCSVKNGHVILK